LSLGWHEYWGERVTEIRLTQTTTTGRIVSVSLTPADAARYTFRSEDGVVLPGDTLAGRYRYRDTYVPASHPVVRQLERAVFDADFKQTNPIDCQVVTVPAPPPREYRRQLGCSVTDFRSGQADVEVTIYAPNSTLLHWTVPTGEPLRLHLWQVRHDGRSVETFAVDMHELADAPASSSEARAVMVHDPRFGAGSDGYSQPLCAVDYALAHRQSNVYDLPGPHRIPCAQGMVVRDARTGDQIGFMSSADVHYNQTAETKFSSFDAVCEEPPVPQTETFTVFECDKVLGRRGQYDASGNCRSKQITAPVDTEPPDEHDSAFAALDAELDAYYDTWTDSADDAWFTGLDAIYTRMEAAFAECDTDNDGLC